MPTALSEEERYPFKEMKEYAVYLAEYLTDSRATCRSSMFQLSMLGRWLKGTYGYQELFQVRGVDVLAAFESLSSSSNWGSNQCNVFRALVNLFLEWAVKEKRVAADFEMPAWPPRRTGNIHTPRVIPPEVLFEVRQMTGLRYVGAAIIELLLSSGMRQSEMFSLNVSQLRFDKIPVDFTTNQPSIYVGGSIVLTKENQAIKGRRSRTVFFSKLAARMIRTYMEDSGIPEGANVPLFPFDTKQMYQCLGQVRREFPELDVKEVKHRLGKEEKIEDYDVENLPDRMKKLVENKVKRNNKFAGPVDPQKNVDTSEKMRGVHPHQFRHTFACYQMHRSYYGERENIARIKTMLGHSADETTLIYLSSLAVIKDDAQWARVWLGRPTDWSRCLPRGVKRRG